MEAIKKKMQAMKLEKDNAVDRAEQAEQLSRDANLRAEKSEEEVRGLQKKIQQIENELDVVQENLSQANVKLEEKEKALQNAEADSAASNRRIQLLEEDLERSEERLKIATQKLEEASQPANESERLRRMLERKSISSSSDIANIRAQFLVDIGRGLIDIEDREYIQDLLDEAFRVQFELEGMLEDDNEVTEDSIDEERLIECCRLKVRLDDILTELNRLEDPYLRMFAKRDLLTS